MFRKMPQHTSISEDVMGFQGIYTDMDEFITPQGFIPDMENLSVGIKGDAESLFNPLKYVDLAGTGTSDPPVWVTSYSYLKYYVVRPAVADGFLYYCNTSHTSSTWSGDSANWTQLCGTTDIVRGMYLWDEYQAIGGTPPLMIWTANTTYHIMAIIDASNWRGMLLSDYHLPVSMVSASTPTGMRLYFTNVDDGLWYYDSSTFVEVDTSVHVNITAFSDYSGTVAGTVKATSVAHGRSTSDELIISGTTNYEGTYTITKIDNNSFYFTDTFISTETGVWTKTGTQGVPPKCKHLVLWNNRLWAYGENYPKGITLYWSALPSLPEEAAPDKHSMVHQGFDFWDAEYTDQTEVGDLEEEPSYLITSYSTDIDNADAWIASNVYAVNAIVRPTVSNGYVYRCASRTGDYKSAATEPDWLQGTIGIEDNNVTWDSILEITYKADPINWGGIVTTGHGGSLEIATEGDDTIQAVHSYRQSLAILSKDQVTFLGGTSDTTFQSQLMYQGHDGAIANDMVEADTLYYIGRTGIMAMSDVNPVSISPFINTLIRSKLAEIDADYLGLLYVNACFFQDRIYFLLKDKIYAYHLTKHTWEQYDYSKMASLHSADHLYLGSTDGKVYKADVAGTGYTTWYLKSKVHNFGGDQFKRPVEIVLHYKTPTTPTTYTLVAYYDNSATPTALGTINTTGDTGFVNKRVWVDAGAVKTMQLKISGSGEINLLGYSITFHQYRRYGR